MYVAVSDLDQSQLYTGAKSRYGAARAGWPRKQVLNQPPAPPRWNPVAGRFLGRVVRSANTGIVPGEDKTAGFGIALGTCTWVYLRFHLAYHYFGLAYM